MKRFVAAASTLLPVLLVLAALCRPALADPSAGEEDWPRFLGNRVDSISVETDLRFEWPDSGPEILWHKEVGEGYAVPSIANGRAFVFDRDGDQARLLALDAMTGKELWRSTYKTDYVDAFEYSGGPRAAPLVDGDRVYVFGVDGRLRCNSVTDGRLLWESDTQERWGVVQNFFGVASSPVVEGDLLIAPIGGSPEGDWDIHQGKVEPNNSGLVAFEKRSGKVVWQNLDELASYSSPIVVELGGKRRGLWLSRDNLVVFDPATGEASQRWPFKAKKVYSVNAATPVVRGDEIFLTESYELGGQLLKWTPVGFQLLWQDPRRRPAQAMANHWNTAVEADGILYGSSGEKSGSAELRAVRWKDGKILWSIPGLNRSTVLLVDDHLVVLTEFGELLLLAATAEEPRILERVKPEAVIDGETRALIRHPSWGAPVLANGILYLRGKDHLVALDLRP